MSVLRKIVLLCVCAAGLTFPVVARSEEAPTAPSATVAAWLKDNPDAPKFSDYPVKKSTVKKAAAVDLASHPDGKLYRGKIREGFSDGVAYAGKYAVAKAGCGTQCMVYWIINLETGKIIASLDAQMGASYRVDSALFIVNSDEGGIDDGTEIDYAPPVTVDFYTVENDRMVLVRELSLPRSEDAVQ